MHLALQVPPENVASHFFWIALPIIMTLGAGQIVSYLANKRRGEEKDQKHMLLERDKDNRLAILLENYRLHEHGENEGPLQAENIRYPRTKADQ